MKQTEKILITALVATSAMTVFSYLVSNAKNRNFREPKVLGELIQSTPLNISKKKANIAGWGMHYAIGIIFVGLFNKYWKQKDVKPTLTSGVVLGAASGLTGIIAWKGMFEEHPKPPKKNLKRYFGHLMLAHLVFGIFSSITYKSTMACKKS